MARPRALQDALKASDEMIEKMSQTEADEPADLDAELKAAMAEPEPEQHRDEPKAEDLPKADPEKDQLKAENQRLDNQYRVLKGKYDAEVPRLSAEIRDLKAQLTDLQNREPQAPEPNVDEIKQKLLDTYTEEEVEALTGLIRAYNTPKKDDSSEIKALREQLQQVTHQTREQQLAALVPDWRQINASEHWVGYLKEVNPESGQERNAHLQEAWQVGDIARVAAIFNTFKQRLSNKAPEPPPVEPEQKASSPKPASADRKVWKASEIEQIAKAYHNGYFRGREAEYRALRDRIEQATVEGRVDMNR